MTTPVIRIEPANPSDVKPEELTGFVDELQVALPDHKVEGLPGHEMPRELRGVTFWQIVNVYLPEAAGSWVVGKVLEAAYHWAKGFFKSRTATLGRRDSRPKYVRVLGADGKEVDSMVLKSVRHKPITVEEAHTPQHIPKRRRKKSKPAKKNKRKKGKGGK
jgi:hypothetical protein